MSSAASGPRVRGWPLRERLPQAYRHRRRGWRVPSSVHTRWDGGHETDRGDGAEEFDGREDALDPAIPLLFAHAGHWSERLAAPFDIVHDDSKTVDRWKDRTVMTERAKAGPDLPVRAAR